jgi:hypothetical protein
MTTPREIYAAYKIMPNLQLHQLRVAAVGKRIAESAPYALDEKSIVLAGLFHDMGNIIKSDLSVFPEFSEPEGAAHWEAVKAEFIQKYGDKTHRANIKIAQELKLPQRVIDIIDAVGFSNIKNVSDGDFWEEKIVEYADCRVGPRGVLPLRERSEEGRVRYIARTANDTGYSEEMFEILYQEAVGLETQIFVMSTITPAEITDESIAPLIEQLWDYPVIQT